MTENVDFTRLLLLIRRATNLIALPESAGQLIRAIDGGEASARDLERIIASDPSLATTVLRVAVREGTTQVQQHPSLRMVIMQLGQKTVRSIAVSLAVKELLGTETGAKQFDPYRFARHALVVGFLARFIYARRQMIEPFDSDWCADEMFSAGVLHDLGIGLLARVSPDTYSRVYYYAKRSNTSLSHAFHAIYGCYPCLLGATAAEAWELPDLFVRTQTCLYSPWENEEEYTAQCCLTYANHLSELLGEALVPWELDKHPIMEAIQEVGLDEAEVEGMKELLLEQVSAYMEPLVKRSSPRVA